MRGIAKDIIVLVSVSISQRHRCRGTFGTIKPNMRSCASRATVQAERASDLPTGSVSALAAMQPVPLRIGRDARRPGGRRRLSTSAPIEASIEAGQQDSPGRRRIRRYVGAHSSCRAKVPLAGAGRSRTIQVSAAAQSRRVSTGLAKFRDRCCITCDWYLKSGVVAIK
jgi:hypothetical protein